MALPTHIDLQIVTPDHPIGQEQVDEVEIPGSEGYFGVLPGHTPMLASLAVGELWYRKGQEKFYLSLAFGFAEVLPDRVTILARLAERAEDIDVGGARGARGWVRARLYGRAEGLCVGRGEGARRRAEQRLSQSASDFDYERARVALTKSLMR